MTNLQYQRDNWKNKAKAGTRLNRNLKRKFYRLFKTNACLKEQLKKEIEKNDALSDELRHLRLIKPIPSNMTTMINCVLLILTARISFRATPRVLSCMGFQGKIPHFTSAINWVCRVGLASLRYLKPPSEPWIAILDMTLDIRFSKALVVLRVPLSIYEGRKHSIGLEDVTCIGVKVGKIWKAENIAQALQEIQGHDSNLKAIIRDGGNDLAKGVELWLKKIDGKDVVTINDISHVAANALKADFDKRESFIKLNSKVHNNHSKIMQSDISYLKPPKRRVSGRYMSLSLLGRWFERVQTLMSSVGLDGIDFEASRLRTLLGKFGNLSHVAKDFTNSSRVLADLMKLLKNLGLNASTFKEGMEIIEKLPPRSVCRTRMDQWMRKHFEIQKLLIGTDTGLAVSSDIIESLFGTFKNFMARNPSCELNHLVLAMPALCGPQSEDRIRRQLAEVSHRDFILWKNSEIGQTGQMKSRKIMAAADLEISRLKTCPS